jgi:simple sugar transport system ATP-binding protein
MSRSDALLEMEGIYKTFPGVVANNHVDFSARHGEIHGLLGENGAGKSTLMKVLFGLYDPEDGLVRYDGELLDVDSPQDAIDAGLGMVHQHFQLVPKMTVAENVVLGLRESSSPMSERASGEGDGLLSRLGRLLTYDEALASERVADVAEEYGIDIDPDRRVSNLDVGEQQRVEILKALYRDVDLLVLDEPTAVLTPTQIDRLFETLRTLVERGLTVVIITHKLEEVTEITDRVTVLREGKRVDTVETAAVDESDLAYMMVGREVIHDIEGTDVAVGDPVLNVSNARAENDRGVELLSGVDLTVREGEILGLAGVSGNGQRALNECIVGTRALTDGSITLDGEPIGGMSTRRRVEAGLSVIPSDRHAKGCAPNLSILRNAIIKDYRSEEFRQGPTGVGMDYGAARDHAKQLIEAYDVRVPGVDVDAGDLSGGNLQKLILGRELDREPAVLIANQPTRGLDVGAIEEVRKRILEQRTAGTGILLISEKFDEIMELSDRIAVIYEGTIVHEVDAAAADRGNVGLHMSGGAVTETEPPAARTDD